MATLDRTFNKLALDESTAAQMAELFSALSDTSRVRIISVLAEREMNVGELAEAVGAQRVGCVPPTARVAADAVGASEEGGTPHLLRAGR